jgi:hypothetical protein
MGDVTARTGWPREAVFSMIYFMVWWQP